METGQLKNGIVIHPNF